MSSSHNSVLVKVVKSSCSITLQDPYHARHFVFECLQTCACTVILLVAWGSGHHRYHGRGTCHVGHDKPPSLSKISCMNFLNLFMTFAHVFAGKK